MRVLATAKDEVVALGFAPGQPLLVAACYREGMYFWDLASDAGPVRTGQGEICLWRPVVFSADGRQVIQPASGRRVAVDLATGQRTLLAPTGLGGTCEFSQTADGRHLIMLHGSYYAPKLTSWDAAADGSGWTEAWTVEPGEGSRSGIALSPNGDYLVHLRRVGGPRWPFRYEVVVRDPRTGNEISAARYPYTYYSRFLFRPDGGQLVAVHEMTLLVWNVPRPGNPMAVRNDTRRHFTAAAFHPSGRYLFTTSNDATVVVWDTTTWQHVTRFTWKVGRLRSVAVSPDGTLAAAGSDKGQVVVWDVDL